MINFIIYNIFKAIIIATTIIFIIIVIVIITVITIIIITDIVSIISFLVINMLSKTAFIHCFSEVNCKFVYVSRSFFASFKRIQVATIWCWRTTSILLYGIIYLGRMKTRNVGHIVDVNKVTLRNIIIVTTLIIERQRIISHCVWQYLQRAFIMLHL